MLGHAFHDILTKSYLHTEVVALGRRDLDITDRDKVLSMRSVNFDYIIHCAADTNADRCEIHPENCYETQVTGTRNILELAELSKAWVFYPQTFLIFHDSECLIGEDDLPNPQSVYATCKLEAERLIRSSAVQSTVVRMAGFFGGDERDKNFVGKFTRHLVKLLNEGTTSYSVGNRIWQPTFTEDLAQNSLLLLDYGYEGVLHMGSEGEVSFFDLARTCVRLLNLDKFIDIVPADEQNFTNSDIALRPHRAILSNERLKAQELYAQRHWEASLAEYLKHPWFTTLYSNLTGII